MANYSRDVELTHPIFYKNKDAILNAINSKLLNGNTAKIISTHRTQADQFELYKKGRTFKNGSWVKTGSTVTNIDGFKKLSMHNYLPCLSIDIGIFDKNGAYLDNSTEYKKVKHGALKIGADWGGDWSSFVDQPHIELNNALLFKSNKILDVNVQWQKYLKVAGAYSKEIDGAFGTHSQNALFEVTGSKLQSIDTWKILIKKFGILTI
jgi:peptidoglycan LD-endopeptidase CwlK